MNTKQIVPGNTIGNYKILELYGKGGMGIVYRAYQATLDREVAFKVMSVDTSADPKLAERFRHEARTAAKLEHSNIVPIYDFGELGEVVYVTMRLLRGGSLDERRKQHKSERITPYEANKLLQPLASALQHAHDQNVIHRDIKGSNILFDEAGVPYISDLGLAKVVGDVSNRTGSGIILGTPTHMAPEQWSGEEVTPAVDQYALAIVVYQLLSGKVPFTADTPLALAMMHTTEVPESLENLVDDINVETSRVVEKAMAKNPSDRFPDVMSFVQAFEKSLETDTAQFSGFFDLQVKHQVPVGNASRDKYQETITPTYPTPRSSGSTVPDGETKTLKTEEQTGSGRGNRPIWTIAAAVIVLVVMGGGLFSLYNPQREGTLRPLQSGVMALSDPHAEAEPIGDLQPNEIYDINGISPDESWYRIQLPNGREGWVRNSASYVRARVAAADLPVILSPTPEPTSTPTRTPEPTLTPTSTPPPTATPEPVTVAPAGTSIAFAAPLATPRLIDQFATRANWVTDLTFSPDGEEILSASTDGRVRWWDPEPIRLRGEMNGSADSVLDVTFNPNISPVGLTLAAGYLDGSVQIWSLGNTQAPLTSIPAHSGSVFAVDYRFDGMQLVSAGKDGVLRLWDLSTLNEIASFEGHDGAVLDAAFSPDGTQIASAGVDGTVRLWDVETGEAMTLHGHRGAVWAVAYSPDGESLATGSEDGTVKLWTRQGVELQTIFGHERAVYTVAFNADGSVVASAGEDPIIQIWDFATGTRLTDILSPESAIYSVAFSPTNDEIAFGGKQGVFGVASISYGDDDNE